MAKETESISIVSEPPKQDGAEWPWIVGFCSLCVIFAFVFKEWDRATAFFGLVGICILVFASIALIRFWRFTYWSRQAMQPIALSARGEKVAAALAFQRNAERATRFRANDVRRGNLLHGMGAYLYVVGMVPECIDTYRECMRVLEQHAAVNLLPYMWAASAFAEILFQTRNYESAQAQLLAMLDWIRVSRSQSKVSLAFGIHDDEWEMNVRARLTDIFVQLGDSTEARKQMAEAKRFHQLLSEKDKAPHHDDLISSIELLVLMLENNVEVASGIFAASRDSLKLYFPAHFKMMLVRQEFSSLETHIQSCLEVGINGSPRQHPAHLSLVLDLAEAQFGQAKHNHAFASLEEARSIVAAFALPPDGAWRRTLANWRERATDLCRPELAASLDADLLRAISIPNASTTILEKLRVHQQPVD